jgi:hypothetical protein
VQVVGASSFAAVPAMPVASVVPVVPVAATAPVAQLLAGATPFVTHPYMPLEPGRVLIYAGTSDGEPFVVVDEVLRETRRFVVDGVAVDCVTQQETEFSDGELTEVSWNYFAQATDGSVLCFGEVVDAYEDGVVVSHDGSWLVGGPGGVDDPADAVLALAPGVQMAAAPAVGDSWKPLDLMPWLDETSTVMALGMRVRVPAGVFGNVMEVEETSDVDEDKPELKWYAPDVGLVKQLGRDGSLGLVSRTP